MPLTPRGVDHLLNYLRARELADSKKSALTLRDLALLREGDGLYSHPEHQALLKSGTADAQRIRQQFEQIGQSRKLTPVVLPYSYPLQHFKFESQSKPELGSRVRSIRRLVHQAQLMQEQLFSEGGDEG